MSSQDSLVVILCDTDGMISQVLRDDFEFNSRLLPGRPWTLLLDAANLDKGLMFFAQIKEHQFASGWELNVRLPEKITPLDFSGGRVKEHILLVGATDANAASSFYEKEILAINNEQVNLIRSLIKEKSALQHKSTSQDILLDDVARLNNELVTLQRRLTKTNRELKQKQRMLESIMETIPDVLYTIDLDNLKPLFSNRSISSVLGYASTEESDSASPFFEAYLHPEDLAHLPERLEKYKHAGDEAVIETEYRLKHFNGSWRWFRSRDTVFERDSSGNPTKVLGIAQDITVYKLLQEKLWHLSTRDALTGLYNRAYFDGELDRIKNGRQFPVSIMVMDINDLKTINDNLGHAAGDRLLRHAAEVFIKAFRGDDVVARIGGDEFAVLLPQTDMDTKPYILKRVNDFIEKHNQASSQDFALSIAIGYATAEHPDQLMGVFRLADEKMYMDKTRIKNEETGKNKEDVNARNS